MDVSPFVRFIYACTKGDINIIRDDAAASELSEEGYPCYEADCILNRTTRCKWK